MSMDVQYLEKLDLESSLFFLQMPLREEFFAISSIMKLREKIYQET